MKNFLVFGASGSIGAECTKILNTLGRVIEVNSDHSLLKNQIESVSKFNGVIWAQGLNLSDSVIDFETKNFHELMAANVLFVLETAKILVNLKKVLEGTNFVVISSIWSELNRPNKLTYSISKSAVSAAVRSMAIDLGPTGIQVNAISPGPIDSPMTRANLSKNQLNLISHQSPLKRMVTLSEISILAAKFANGEITGVTGQEIVMDAGWGISKLV
jgi:3-oxoacyl-[acyl-carrier protein] reductase